MRRVLSIPPDMNPHEVLATIEKIVSNLAPGFVFGYFSVEDIRQQGRLFALEALGRWDGKRTLENFLFKHVKNRLINYKRDKFHRADPPCKECERAYPLAPTHADGKYCAPFLEWKDRNLKKQLLARSLKVEPEVMARIMQRISDDDVRAPEVVGMTDLDQRIDALLPYHLRPDYLRMKEGVTVPLERREEVREAVGAIVAGSFDVDELRTTGRAALYTANRKADRGLL